LIGGLDLAAEWAGFETVGQCEFADFPTKALEKHWPDVPRWRDIKVFSGWSLGLEDGLCYNKICEMTGDELLGQRISGEDEQQNDRPRLERLKRLLNSAEIAGSKCPYIQALSQAVKGNTALTNAVTSISEETTALTPVAANGCGEQVILDGVEGFHCPDGQGQIKQPNSNGDGALSPETAGCARFVELNPVLGTEKRKSITSKDGESAQKADLMSIMESLFASLATINCTRRAARLSVLSAGVPCQPASVAGKRRGAADDRWLWPEALRIVRETRPTWIVFENVKGLVTLSDGMEFERISLDMEREGYEVQSFVFPAAAVGAPHRRERVFFVANAGSRRSCGGGRDVEHADCERREELNLSAVDGEAGFAGGRLDAIISDTEHDGSPASAVSRVDSKNASWGAERAKRAVEPAGAGGSGCDGDVADAYDGCGAMRRDGKLSAVANTKESGCNHGGRTPEHVSGEWWAVERGLGDEADGLPGFLAGRMNWWDWDWDSIPRVTQGEKNRADKLKALGNAVAPPQAYPIFRAIAEIEKGGHV